MTRPLMAVQSVRKVGRQSAGAAFGASHNCPSGERRELHWERNFRGEDIFPRRWLVCDNCGYAVKLVIRHPDGSVPFA